MLPQIYTLLSNVFCAAVLLSLMGAVRRRGDSQQLRMLMVMFYGAFFYLATETAWGLVEGSSFAGARTVNYIVNALDFSTAVFLAFQWLRYYELCYPSAISSTKIRRLLCFVPLTVLLLMSAASPFTGWFFSVDAANIYHSGPLYFVQLMGTYTYLAAVIVKGIILCRRADTTAERGTHFSHIRYVLVLLVFGIINAHTADMGLYVHCFGVTLGLLLYFVNMQEQQITRDVLTGTNNRYALEGYLKSHMDAMDDAVILMLDIDNFKQINDYFGHVEGDRALKLVAEALKHLKFGTRYFLARYGGDEFVIIVEAKDSPGVVSLCRTAADAVAAIRTQREYSLTVSVGWAEKRPNFSAKEWLRLADERMYDVKVQRHVGR